jgi:transposase-like protein
MFANCPRKSCVESGSSIDAPNRSLHHGRYVRKSDSRTINRYLCLRCRRTFSGATDGVCFGQRNRRINHLVYKHLVCGNSLRRTARMLGVDPKTVTRKMRFLANQFRIERLQEYEDLSKIPERMRSVMEVDADEMESSVLSKCLPVTIALAVERPSRKILSFHVDTITAKGKLAEISLKKYGFRENRSEHAFQMMMNDLKRIVHPRLHFQSDQKPTYAGLVKKNFPDATHTQHKSRRAVIVGYGELKQKGFDPLFAINHTAAMIRYGVSRLHRRTWCTSKTIQGLRDHLELYVRFHNSQVA